MTDDKKKSLHATKLHAAEFFETFNALKIFPRKSIPDLSSIVKFLILETGEVLFSQGNKADAMFIVLEGQLQTLIRSTCGREIAIKKMRPGDSVGLIPVMTGGTHCTTVKALEESTLAIVKKNDLQILLSKYPDIKKEILETVSFRLKRTHLAEVLPQYFDEMDEATFDYIETLFEWVHIKRGDILYNKDDVGDSLYVLINGLLHVIDMERSDPHRVLAEITRGEIVGEMALLSDEVRTASIHAARDCDLVKLSRTSFESISEKFPQVMMAITRVLVDRLKNVGTSKSPKRKSITFTILPSSAEVSAEEFCLRFEKAISCFGSTFLLNDNTLDDYLQKKGISHLTEDDPRDAGLRASLAEIEHCHDFVIYQAENNPSAWTKRSVKRADTVIIIANADASPDLTEIEKQIEGDDFMTTTPRKTLALIHKDGKQMPKGTATWLEARHLRGHNHIRWDREDDFGRLARVLSNRAIGLVLGGGAAKGIAHVGVIQALQELGIPIDMVGGASMGSIIGAYFAMDNDHISIMEMCRKLFIDMNPFNEYTLPLISIMRGRKLEKMGKVAFGDTNVEDLWINYFCVSSNLTTSQVKIHRTGSLWKAVRTSSSIPGVMSPVLEDGEVYVDGGVINNLPGDIMRRQCSTVIVVEVSPNLDLTTKITEIPSPWKLLARKLIPFKKSIKMPSILDIMLSTVLTGSFIAANSVKHDADLSLTPPLQDIGFMDFKKMEKITAVGYKYTLDVLNQLENRELSQSLKNRNTLTMKAVKIEQAEDQK
jgi:NTE family protein